MKLEPLKTIIIILWMIAINYQIHKTKNDILAIEAKDIIECQKHEVMLYKYTKALDYQISVLAELQKEGNK